MDHFEKNMLDIFNIPKDIKHHHDDEALALIESGIVKLDLMLKGGHDKCVHHMVKYAELNIKFFFVAHLLTDKAPLMEAFALFVVNMESLFKVATNANDG